MPVLWEREKVQGCMKLLHNKSLSSEGKAHMTDNAAFCFSLLIPARMPYRSLANTYIDLPEHDGLFVAELLQSGFSR